MLSPQQLLGKLEDTDELLVCDLEAGVIALNGMAFTPKDTVLVVTDPTRQSIDAAQRLAAIASDLSANVVVVANRVTSAEEERAIEAALQGYDCVVVREDPEITLADRDGLAPLDAAPNAPGVLALVGLAQSVTAPTSPQVPVRRP